MQRSSFARANLMVAAIAGLLVGAYKAMPGKIAASREQAYEMLGGYKSNGKGKTRSHDYGGTRASQRAALKKRNQLRHRKACRG